MKPKISWTMAVAVINSCHMPGPRACEGMYRYWNEEGGAVILYIGDLDADTPEWLKTLANPLLEQGFEWVRFDTCGDTVEGLPTFKWG